MTDKKNLWEEIQRRIPEFAKILQYANKTFGKPERVTVVFKREGA